MHTVKDKTDPDGHGMFSKAGRFKNKKSIILQRKDEILYNKKRVFKVTDHFK